MNIRRCRMMILLMALVVGGAIFLTQRTSAVGGDHVLDDQLSTVLNHHGFTGRVGSSMEQRLGRKIDNQLADLGRNLFHDTIVGLNNDNSVRRLKGPSRPVQGAEARAAVLASLADVDLVVLFEEDTPLKLIEAIRPSVLVKGSDYSAGEIVGADFVESYGGRVELAPLLAGHSTSRTITRSSLLLASS